MPEIKWMEFRDHSGLLIHGQKSVALPKGDDAAMHMQRAFYLVSQIEAPNWGTVQSYDGAGISGGPLHSVAYLPKQHVQGSLFKLIAAIQSNVGAQQSPALQALQEALLERCWQVSNQGVLIKRGANKRVPGPVILDTFAPVAGKVPSHGSRFEQAKRWLLLFHRLFADKNTYIAQKDYCINQLCRGARQLERSAYEGLVGSPVETPELLRVSPDHSWETPGLSLEADLSMCVYHAYSVNAPGVARRLLEQALTDTLSSEPVFATHLIRSFGKSTYGRWADTADDKKSRYDNIRQKARTSGLWPETFFTNSGLMPKNLDGRIPQRMIRPKEIMMKQGDGGSEVKELQQKLAALGYNPGEVDGKFGRLTQRAVKRFQKDHNLRIDGIAGKATIDALASSAGVHAVRRRPESEATSQNAVDAFLHSALKSSIYMLQKDALAAYWEACQDQNEKSVDFRERVARTAEWFLEQGVTEVGGQNRGPWVDFIRVIGGGAHRPSGDYPPWCAFFVSACLKISRWTGDYNVKPKTGAGAVKLYLNAPKACQIPYNQVDSLETPRGCIFVRTRTSESKNKRNKVLESGAAVNGHTGIVVDRESSGNLVCIAGNSSGAGHARASGTGAVAYEMIGSASTHAKEAKDRLVGLVRY